MLENFKNIKMSRDTKVNLAFAGFFTASLLTGGGLSAPFLIGSAASNLLGCEAVKSGLNWLNRRAEGDISKNASA